MKYEWDEAKSAETWRRRGFGFEVIKDWVWDHAICVEVQTHGLEEREKWIAPIGDRLFVAVLTQRGEAMRVISLRRATQNEIAIWRREIGT